MDVLDRLFRRLVQNIRAGHPQYLSEPFGVAELFQTLVPYRHNRAELGIEMNQDYELALMRLLAGERDYVRGDPAMQTALSEALLSPHPDTTRYREFADARVMLNPDAATRVEPAGAPALAAHPAAERTVVMGAGRAEPPPPPRPALASTGVMPTQLGDAGFGAQPRPEPRPETRAERRAERRAEPPPPPPPPPPPRLAPEPERAGAEAAFPDPSAFGFPLRTPPAGGASRPSGSSPVAPAPAPTPPGSAPGILAQGSCRYCGGTLPDGRRITYCPHCGQNLTVRQCPACSTELELGWRFCVTCGRQVT